MTINYNVTGNQRKRLADYISGFMGTEKKYLGAPTFAYQIGYLTVSKDGEVSFEDRGYNSDIDALVAELAESDESYKYINYLVVKEGNEESVKTKAMIAALENDDVKDYIEESYSGSVIPAF